MAWTTLQAPADSIDDEIADFEGQSGTSSIDSVDITSIGSNRIIALVEYTEA